jgi:WhiB family redox-sensing transcriptional regulator
VPPDLRPVAPPALVTGRAPVSPRPHRPDQSWRRAAACLGHDVSVFFPEDGDHEESTARAKAVCATCPVQPRCLQHALDYREHNGIWGGTTEAERRRILRQQRRRIASAG